MGFFEPTEGCHILRGIFTSMVDLPSVFKIDKIQDRSVCVWQSLRTYTSNLLVASRAFKQYLAKISYQIELPMSLAPTYEAIRCETSGKP